MGRADVVTAQTEGAIVAPLRQSVGAGGDVFVGAEFDASATGLAG